MFVAKGDCGVVSECGNMMLQLPFWSTSEPSAIRFAPKSILLDFRIQKTLTTPDERELSPARVETLANWLRRDLFEGRFGAPFVCTDL
jgi:hypothetical protein